MDPTTLAMGFLSGTLCGAAGTLAYQRFFPHKQEDGNVDLELMRAEIKQLMEGNEKRTENDERFQNKIISALSRMSSLMVGRKSGQVGENILAELLKNEIATGKIKEQVQIGSEKVEFAYELHANKMIPIDSKFVDVMNLIVKFEETKDDAVKKQIQKKIQDKVSKGANDVYQKYVNRGNMWSVGIVAVPTGAFNFLNGILAKHKEKGVLILPYEQVPFICHILEQIHSQSESEYDERKMNDLLFSMLKFVDSIDEQQQKVAKKSNELSLANNQIGKIVGEAKSIKAILEVPMGIENGTN